MRHILCLVSFGCLTLSAAAQSTLAREQWGAPPVSVTRKPGSWIIAGRKNSVTVNEKDLSLQVAAGAVTWAMAPSAAGDLRVRTGGGPEFALRLAEARSLTITNYDTGYKTGVKITLSQWQHESAAVDLTLYLTICLEGPEEEMVCDAAADERGATVRQLDWPGPLDAREVDDTVLSNAKGNLLPRTWPKEYSPIRSVKEGKIVPTDHSVLQSHVIESWSMSWWGFEKGKSAMMVIVETPDDAAYQFSHPAGGPTVIGPRWLATLGRLGYPRAARMCFFEEGNYVTLAKRYRRYAMETGLFVSLREKIARTPMVAEAVGTPQTHLGILRNLKSDSGMFDHENPSNNYSLTTFDERARQLRELKGRGIERTMVFVSGWAHLGYDRQHPDALPPAEAAGGWAGAKRLAETCRELGYPFLFHDQYRDYYVDAPSYDRQFAIHEEDESLPPKAFPGSRFGDSKEGEIPFMNHWQGGKQSYLDARFMAGHLRKNYELFFEHGIHPQGIYLDVFGYVPPDEDFNPEHPTTRSEAMRGIAECLNWSRQNLGLVATEAGSDWVVPYVDSVNQSGSVGKCIAVPLYQLVYHDAVLISYGAQRNGGEKNLLMGLLCGGVPDVGVTETDGKTLALVKEMAALHKRVGLLEMTNHEFLDKERKQERTAFADGTTVTVDWDAGTARINPELP